jgi:Wnt-binding factor required for Wnt secretion
VWARDDPNADATWKLLYTRSTTQDVVCDSGPGECISLVLVDDQDLEYTYYQLHVRVLNGGMLPGDTVPFVGDVRFVTWLGHSGFSSLELALRIIYLFIVSVLLVVFLWCMRATPLDEWAWEQRALVVLLLALLGLNSNGHSLPFIYYRSFIVHLYRSFISFIIVHYRSLSFIYIVHLYSSFI